VIVIYDDLDLPVGRLRLRAQGGAGGHRGIESLLEHLGQDAFARVRIGIGRPPQHMETIAHVLGRFTTEEASLILPVIGQAAEAVEAIIEEGVTKAGNKYNK
jgi:PTH1 family peptidyl-tRNA hydrolase